MGVNYSGSYANPRLDLGVAFMEHAADMAEFVGMQIMPRFLVQKNAATFSVATREKLLQDSEAKRAVRSAYNRINTEAEDKSYECFEYGLECVVDDREREIYAGDFAAEELATKTTARALMLQYEKRVATAIFNTTTWTGASLFTDNSTSPWDTASSDVIGHILAAKEKVRTGTGMQPNTLLLSAAQLSNLLKNTGIKNQFPGAPLVTEAMIRQALVAIFGLTKLVVGGAVRNSAIEGQAFVSTDVWTDDYAMVALTCDQDDALSTPCVGRTVVFAPDGDEVVVETYRDVAVRGDVVRARHSLDELVIDSAFGHLMKID